VRRLGLGVRVKTSLVIDSENETALMAPQPRHSSLNGTVAGACEKMSNKLTSVCRTLPGLSIKFYLCQFEGMQLTEIWPS